MIDLTVKTLDSRNHAFSVPDDTTVRQLKAKIEETMSIGVDSQRLIYCGRVLQDEKKLAECDVNGKVIHLVQRAPPSASRPTGPGGLNGQTDQSRRAPRHPFNTNAMYLGTIAIPVDSHGLMGGGFLDGQGRNNAAAIMTTAERMLDRAGELLNRLENPPPTDERDTQESNIPTEESNANASEAQSMEEALSEGTTATVIAATLSDPDSAPSITLSSVTLPPAGEGTPSGEQTSALSNQNMNPSEIIDLRFMVEYARTGIEAAARAARAAATAAAAAEASGAAAAAATASGIAHEDVIAAARAAVANSIVMDDRNNADMEAFFSGMRAGGRAGNGERDGAAARAEAFVSGMRSARTATNAPNAPAGNAATNASSGDANRSRGLQMVIDAMDGYVDTSAPTEGAEVTLPPSGDPSEGNGAASVGEGTRLSSAPAGDRPASDEGNGRRQNGNRSATPATLASVFEKLNRVNARFQPFLERYHEMLRDDPPVNNDPAVSRERRVLASSVPEMMHLLSHAYHAISDLKLNVDAPPPRQMRTVSTSVVHTSIPLLEQINITTERPVGSRFQSSPGGNIGGNMTGRNTSTPSGGTNPGGAATPTPGRPQNPTNQTGAGTGTDSSWTGSPRIPTPTPDLRSMFDINMPSNLEFFVEVGPSGFTVGSLDPSGGPTPAPPSNNGPTGAPGDENGGNFPWNLASPPEFIQNLITAVAGHVMGGRLPTTVLRTSTTGTSTSATNTPPSSTAPASSTGAGPGVQTGQAGGQNSQARGNTATHPTTATQTRSTARPHVHFAAAPIPELVLSTGNNDFDPFLPCNSHHVIPYVRRSHPLRPGVVSRPPSAANAGTAAPTTTTPTAPTATATATATPNPVEETVLRASEATFPSSPNLFQASPDFATTSLYNFVHDIAQVPNQSGAGLEFLSLMLSPLSGSSVGASLPETLLREFFQNRAQDDEEVEVEGQSLITDLRLAVIRAVTLSDLMGIMVGNWNMLNHARPELSEFVRRRLLENQPATDENVERASTALLQELRCHMDILLEAPVRDDIDIVASVTRFHEAIIPEFIRFFTNEENEEANFGANLYTLMRRYFVQLSALIIVSCTNAEEGLKTILLAFLRRMVRNNIPTIVNWMGNTIVERLPPGFHLFEPVQQFIVRRARAPPTVSSAKPEPMDTDPSSPTEPVSPALPKSENAGASLCSSSLSATSSATSSAAPSAAPLPVPVPVPLAPTPTPASTSSSCPTVVNATNSRAESAAMKATKVESTTLVPMDTDSGAPEVNRPEPWHRGIPPEWLPVITRDGQRQRRTQQTPLSDAYLSGMPPKRRKLVTDSKPQGSLNQVITASVQQAVQAAGVSQAGVSLVQEAAVNDLTFQEAYRDQLRATVRANLANNPDFSAERYPNAARYFCQ